MNSEERQRGRQAGRGKRSPQSSNAAEPLEIAALGFLCRFLLFVEKFFFFNAYLICRYFPPALCRFTLKDLGLSYKMLVNILKGLVIFPQTPSNRIGAILHENAPLGTCFRTRPGGLSSALPSVDLRGPEPQDKPRNHRGAGGDAEPMRGRRPACRCISFTGPEARGHRAPLEADSEPWAQAASWSQPHGSATVAPNKRSFLLWEGFIFPATLPAARSKAQQHF